MEGALRRILVIEDDAKARATIRLFGEHEGFEVLLAEDGEAGLRMARTQSPHLVVLDLMLPRLDGLALCRVLRSESAVPIIMVTARASEQDKLRGLAGGADDYLTKPFSPRELMARVRAVLRRSAGDVIRQRTLRGGRVRVDLAARLVLCDGAEVPLTATEFRILALLAQGPRLWRRDELIERAGVTGSEAAERTIDTHVSNLRRKLALSGEPSLIATVFGEGYRLEP